MVARLKYLSPLLLRHCVTSLGRKSHLSKKKNILFPPNPVVVTQSSRGLKAEEATNGKGKQRLHTILTFSMCAHYSSLLSSYSFDCLVSTLETNWTNHNWKLSNISICTSVRSSNIWHLTIILILHQLRIYLLDNHTLRLWKWEVQLFNLMLHNQKATTECTK